MPTNRNADSPGAIRSFVITSTFCILYLFACFYLVQSARVNDIPYINLHDWAHGRAGLPYQRRDLLAPLLRAAEQNPSIGRRVAAQHGLGIFADPDNYPLFVINLASILLSGLLVTLLYRRASKGPLWWLPASLLLVFLVFSISLRWEHRYLFPYDLLSMFFFTLGLVLIDRGWAYLLIPLMPLATANRETTIMWVPLLAITAWLTYRNEADRARARRQVLLFAATATVLVVLWAVTVHHMAAPYLHNDASENYPRFSKNLHAMLTLKGWIEPFSAFAFTLPFLLAFHRRVQYPVIRATLITMLPLWFAIMFYQGEIVESRVFAEMLPFAAVAAVLIFEGTYITQPSLHSNAGQ